MNKLINTEMYNIHLSDIRIPEIGDLAICCNCFEEKKIFDRVKVKKHNEAVITWYCEDCSPEFTS